MIAAVSWGILRVPSPVVGSSTDRFTSEYLYNLLAHTCTSQYLYLMLCWCHDRGGVPRTRRPQQAGDPATGARPPAVGQRDRGAVRHHSAGGLPAPEGAQGRGPGGGPPTGPAAVVRGAPGRPHGAAGFPRRVLARQPATAKGSHRVRRWRLNRSSPPCTSTPSRSESTSTSPGRRRSSPGWASTPCSRPSLAASSRWTSRERRSAAAS